MKPLQRHIPDELLELIRRRQPPIVALLDKPNAEMQPEIELWLGLLLDDAACLLREIVSARRTASELSADIRVTHAISR